MIRLLRNHNGSAAVEAAIFLPIFLLLTLGITDLGSAMFVRQNVNAAAQAGATYAVVNSSAQLPATPICATMSAECLSSVQAAMNAAAGGGSYCNGTCASITGCADGSPKCVTVTASYSLSPVLPSALYTWAGVMNISYTITVRIS